MLHTLHATTLSMTYHQLRREVKGCICTKVRENLEYTNHVSLLSQPLQAPSADEAILVKGSLQACIVQEMQP